ncbi:MAG: hypothetical protein ACP5HD_01285 [Thermoproteus sp.]
MRRFVLVTSTRAFAEQPYVHGKALVAALLISNGIREDAEFVAYFIDAARAIRVLGNSVRSLFPDEESSTGLLRRALRGARHPGVKLIERASLADLIRRPVVDGRRGVCKPPRDFTYVAYLEPADVEVDCGAGLGDMPPHHQFAVFNIEADRQEVVR